MLPLPCNISHNVTRLWHHCLHVVNMVFTEEDKVAIKFLCELSFLKDFPAKQWSLSGLNRILKKIYGRVLSNERRVSVGRSWCTVMTTSNALHECHPVVPDVACRTQLLLLVNDFNIYQHLLLIFIAVSVIEFEFCPAVFYRFVQLVTLRWGGQSDVS